MKTLTSLFLLVLTLNSWAKPIGYYIPDLLGSAKFVDEVVITGYDSLEHMINFQSLTYQDTLNQASCAICEGYQYPNPDVDQWTNNMPFVGDTVLVIVNSYGTAAVFGKKVKDNYRLWSSVFSGSIAIFRFEAPVQPLNRKEVLDSSGTTKACWDGCLIPKSPLSQLVNRYRKEFNEKLENVDLSTFENTEVYNLFYDESLKYHGGILWWDEPPGKLRWITIRYANGRSLEVTPHTEGNQPAQFSIHRAFDLEEFKKMKIKKIVWEP